MSNKLKIPQRQQGQDDNQYAEAVKASIKEQRPYLSDNQINDLASVKVSLSIPKPTPKAVTETAKPFFNVSPKPQSIKEMAEARKTAIAVEKPQPFKSTAEMVSTFVPNQQAPTLEDPNRAAATVRMLEKFIPEQPKEEPIELIGRDFAPEQPRQEPQINTIGLPTQVAEQPIQQPFIQQQDGQAENIRQQLLAKQNNVGKPFFGEKELPLNESLQPKEKGSILNVEPKRDEFTVSTKDKFDEAAEIALPQGSPNEKMAYAETLRGNANKVADFSARQIASTVDDGEFEKAINKEDIVKGDRGALMSQKFGGDANEINKSLREYIDSQDFKAKVIRQSDNNPSKYQEAAKIVLDQKANELAYAPTALQKKMQKFSDWAATSNMPIYTPAKTLTSAVKGLADVGAFGAAVITSVGRSMQDLSNNRMPDFEGDMYKSLEKSDRLMQQGLPQVQSEKASGFVQGVSDVTSTIAAIVTPMSAVKPLSIFQKAKQALSGVKGVAGLETGAIAESMSARKTAANTFTKEVATILNSKSANNVAQILDNTANNYIIMGAPTMLGQKQKYLDMGFSDEEANRRASSMTFLTMLGLALPNVIRPHQQPIIDRILEKASATNIAKGALKQGRNFAVDMGVLGAIEKRVDKAAMEDAKIEQKETTFAEDLAEAATKGKHDMFVGIGMNLLTRGKVRQTSVQRMAMAEAFEKPYDYSEGVKDAVRKGKISKEQAEQYQSYLNTIKPEYEAAKAAKVVLPNGKEVPKYTPEKAVQVAIEKVKINQAKNVLAEVLKGEEKWVTFATDKDGKGIEQVIYRHSDGKMYEYPDPKIMRKKNTILFAMEDAAKQILQIERGEDVRGKLVSAKEMVSIAEANSLNGQLKEGQKEAIEKNAPYEDVVYEVVDFKDQPEVAAKVKEFEAMDELPELPTANDPIVVDGKVVEGTAQVARQIVLHGAQRAGVKMTFAAPVEKETIKAATNEAFETKVGDITPKVDGLPENEAQGVVDVSETFNKGIEEGKDAATALVEAAKEAVEMFVEPEIVAERLKDATGEGTFSDAMIDNAVKEAKKENVPQETLVGVGVGGDVEVPKDILEQSLKETPKAETQNLENELGEPTITKVEDGDLYEFKTKDGLVAGVMVSPTEFRIDGISAKNVGEGQGSKMFESLIRYLDAKGVKIISTSSAGEGAKKMHDKAVENGMLNRISEDGRSATFEILKPKENGTDKLESVDGGSSRQSEQSEGEASGAEQVDVRANEAKAEYDKLLELHNKKRESKNESRKEAAQEEAKKLTEGKPDRQVLSENFKNVLLRLKSLKEIEVQGIEDC